MNNPTEILRATIWNILPALRELGGDEKIVTSARRAADNLSLLIEAGGLRSKEATSSGLMDMINRDPKTMASDQTVASVLLDGLDQALGYAKLSGRELSERSGLSIPTVRRALKRLVDRNYFHVIRPTQFEWEDGDHTLKYAPVAVVPQAA